MSTTRSGGGGRLGGVAARGPRRSPLWTLRLVPLPGLAFLLLLLVPEDQREGGDRVVVLLGLGLAGRLHEADPYDVPGPAVAGWLCRPVGRVQPDALHDLAELARRHGVAWRDYAGAEVA